MGSESQFINEKKVNILYSLQQGRKGLECDFKLFIYLFFSKDPLEALLRAGMVFNTIQH